MLRTALFAVLLTGLASTAMASDRVRVVVSYDSGYSDHGYYSVRDRGHYRDYRNRGHYPRYDRRWDRGRHYGWRGDGYYYSRPYYRSYDRGYYDRGYYRDRGYYYGSRGYRHDRYCPDRWHRH
jgi:hypothetical protein